MVSIESITTIKKTYVYEQITIMEHPRETIKYNFLQDKIMTKLQDIPAFIYTMLYARKKDGRLRKATEHKKFDILFNFPDFPPAALLKINNGDYEVMAIDNVEGISADTVIKGNFVDFVEITGGMGLAVKLALTGKVKIKGLKSGYQLLKILLEKEAL